jgi:hypothetical protein
MRYISDNTLEGNADKSQQPVEQQGPDYSVGSPDFLQTIKNGLGISENAGRYNTNPNVAGAMGKYQFIPARLQELGYSHVDQTNFTPQLQEEVMDKHLQDLISYGQSKGYITPTSQSQDVAGLIWAGHLGGKGGIDDVVAGRAGASDAFGTSTSAYYNKGQRKFSQAMLAKSLSDVDLGRQASGTALAYSTAGNIQPPTSSRELYNLALESTYSGDTILGRNDVRASTLASAIDQINKTSGVDFKAMMDKYSADQTNQRITTVGHTTMLQGPTEAQAFDAVLKQLQAQQPNVKLPVASYNDILQQAGQTVKNLQTEYAAKQESATWSQWAAGLAGSFVGFMKDPFNLAAMAASTVAGPAGLGLGAIAGRAAITGLAEIPVQAGVQGESIRQGDEAAGVVAGATNVAAVTLGSAALDGVASSVIRGAKNLWNKGGSGTVEFSKTLQNDTAGTIAPIQDRVQDMMGKYFEESGDVLKHAPMGDTPQGRYHLETSLDQAERLAVQNKPMFVLPDTAPTYFKTLQPETQAVIDGSLAGFDKEFQAVARQELSEFETWKKGAVTGTEQEAVTVPIAPQEVTPLKEVTSKLIQEKYTRIQEAAELPTMSKEINTRFDTTLSRYASSGNDNELAKALEIKRLQDAERVISETGVSTGETPRGYQPESRTSSIDEQLTGLQKAHTELTDTYTTYKTITDEASLSVKAQAESYKVLKAADDGSDNYKIQLSNAKDELNHARESERLSKQILKERDEQIKQSQAEIDTVNQQRAILETEAQELRAVSQEELQTRVQSSVSRLQEMERELTPFDRLAKETFEIEDEAGNVIKTKADGSPLTVKDVLDDVHQERTGLRELADCITRQG